jgi:hypothetical protein
LALAFLALAGILSLASPAAAFRAAQTVERRLKVKVDKAFVRSEPDPGSPVIAVLRGGAEVTSYEALPGYFRIVFEAGRDAVTRVGYIADPDVKVLGEKVKDAADFWSESSPVARSGLEICFSGGYAMFGGGDFASGVGGLFDELKAMIAGLGYPITRDYYHPLDGGMQIGAGLFWRFSSRLAAGLIGEYSLAQRFNEFGFREGVHDLGANSTPVMTTLALRPGLRCGILTGGPVELSVTAGPAFFFSSFKYNLGVSYDFVVDQGTTRDYAYYLKVQRTFLGAFLAADLDIRLNARSAIVLQATYRMAQPAGWSGSDKTSLLIANLGGEDASENSGLLFSTIRGLYPVLAVSAESPGPGASEAVLDYSGLSLQAGLRIRF